MLKLNKTHYGDCFDLLGKVSSRSIDLIIIDPPYLTTNNTWDRTEMVNKHLAAKLFRVAKKSCSLYVWCGIGEKSQSLIRWFPIFSRLWYFKELITWKKQRGIGMRRGWLYTREESMWFVKDNKEFIWNKEHQLSTEQYEECWQKRLGRKYKRCTNVWTDIKEETLTGACGIKGAEKKMVDHATPKPIKALERIIKVHTKKHDLVLDCFAGSGTTGIACENLGRNYILIEREEKK
jgi:site-specific DNA-methyltransferase (adenine-specific)